MRLAEGELEEATSSFAPIPLAVLDREATLATRSERKYILDAETCRRLLRKLGPHYLILEIDGARVFPYDTVYFDTPALTTYRQHLQGRRRRFKCRTRLYAGSEICFFEVKLKGGRGETIKRRLEIGIEEHGSLTIPALAFLERELHQAYGTSPPAALAPALRTAYRRLTLVGRASSERLTVDLELVLAANGKEYSIEPGRILLETKTDTGAGEADRALRALRVRPIASCSKYCLGVALAHPELPDNPFRPLLRHHFISHAPLHAYEPRRVAPPVGELGPEEVPLAPAEVVRRAIAAHNRRDIDGVRRYVHDAADAYTFLVVRAGTPFNRHNESNGRTGSRRAPRSIPKWLANGAGFPGVIEVETLDLVEADGRVLGFGQVMLSANGNGRARTVETAWVWEIRDGKISYMASYLDPRDALGAVALGK